MSPLLYPDRLVKATARALKALAGSPYAALPLKELEANERSLLPQVKRAAGGDFDPYLESMRQRFEDRRRRGFGLV